VTVRFERECALAHWLEMRLLRIFEIFIVSSAFRFLDGCIVMGFKNLMNESDDFIAHLPSPSTVVVVKKQAKETTSIPYFSLLISLPPVLFGCPYLFATEKHEFVEKSREKENSKIHPSRALECIRFAAFATLCMKEGTEMQGLLETRQKVKMRFSRRAFLVFRVHAGAPTSIGE
jgi:hypothetical protein